VTTHLPVLVPRAAFAGRLVEPVSDDLQLEDRDGLGLATILVRKGREQPLRQRVLERFGLQLPQGPLRAHAGATAFAGIGVGAWLASREQAGNAFAASLQETLGDLGAVSDQSDAYAVLRVSGVAARGTLGGMMSLDLHQRSFKPGQVAVTAAEHIGVTLWCLEETPSGGAVFEMAVFRSLAADFAHRLAGRFRPR
jgi:methylglutamate dehydrogenase subunit D